jgi:hypothetical protein
MLIGFSGTQHLKNRIFCRRRANETAPIVTLPGADCHAAPPIQQTGPGRCSQSQRGDYPLHPNNHYAIAVEQGEKWGKGLIGQHQHGGTPALILSI